nr:RING/U-box superfamily protein [Tanacetum cinerariifolium]
MIPPETGSISLNEHSLSLQEEADVCRICMDELQEVAQDTLKLECHCRGELALAHKKCAVKWFSDRGNMICEICNHEVMNLYVMHSPTFRVDDDFHNLRSVETKFLAIVVDDIFTSQTALSYESKVSPPIDYEIEFRVSFDESNNDDYTIIYDKKLFSYKIIYVGKLKMDSKNDNENVNIPSFPSLEPMISYIDDLDLLKDFENEFPAIVYNGAQTSKSDFLTEPTLSPLYIDEFDLKNETSLSKCDEAEHKLFYFNDLFLFSIIYPDDLQSDKDNDNNEIDIIQSSRDKLNTQRFIMVWQHEPGLLILSILAYWVFLVLLLNDGEAVAISVPFGCILGLLGSMTSTIMVRRRYAWIYATVQFILVVCVAYAFRYLQVTSRDPEVEEAGSRKFSK